MNIDVLLNKCFIITYQTVNRFLELYYNNKLTVSNKYKTIQLSKII